MKLITTKKKSEERTRDEEKIIRENKASEAKPESICDIFIHKPGKLE